MKDIFTEILTKPIRYTVLIAAIISSFLLILLVLFLPTEMAIKLNLIDFFDKYSGFILITFFTCLFLLIAQSIPDIYKKISNIKKIKAEKKKIQEAKDDLYNDEYAWRILLDLYHAKGKYRLLVRSNQKVLLLEKFGMIARTSNSTLTSAFEMHDAQYPYVLQPDTEKYIREYLQAEKLS